MDPHDLDQRLRDSLPGAGGGVAVFASWFQSQPQNPRTAELLEARAFAVAEAALSSRPAGVVMGWLRSILPGTSAPAPVPSSEAFFSPGEACLGRIVERFRQARRRADVCVFTITDDRITRALLDAHRRGVAVRVVTDNDKSADLGSDIEQIAAAGVPVKVDRTPYHMHHKFALFDGARLINGSYNWTRGAANQNEENLVDTADPALLAAFQREFDALWAKL